MKSYGSEQCVPFDYYFGRKDSREKYDDSREEGVLEEACTETELALGSPMDEDQEQTEFEDVLDRLRSAAEEGFEVDIPNGQRVAAEDFDEDHVTCYLREVAGYPLLTQGEKSSWRRPFAAVRNNWCSSSRNLRLMMN